MERPPLQIFYRNLSGHSVTLDVSPTDTIRKIKERITEIEGIPVDEQRLMKGGEQLVDDRSLQDSGVDREATLELALRLLGGPPTHPVQARVTIPSVGTTTVPLCLCHTNCGEGNVVTLLGALKRAFPEVEARGIGELTVGGAIRIPLRNPDAQLSEFIPGVPRNAVLEMEGTLNAIR
ncbi:hypothetical protein PAPYR_11056 [Paratrimastix pyriformis]|uniref:Ubiquitin-like domain-containing protein n=1 Tax=Paratrimastix pyriformis TaxID=342808 RepID=A0ABQ8UAA8_9EUKA|nr:hypothetical protein PAPYR_11056 [Paratrimastix pyriformis]